MTFADHFSGVAHGYARFRPSYPDSLFRLVSGATSGRDRAWDCGSGSGQAAVGLRRHFRRVVATDASPAQLREGLRVPGVCRVACTAERPALADRSVDLVTAAQALHWMDADAFFRQVRRVVRPGGAVAVWSYTLCSIDGEVDPVLRHLYHSTLGEWWSPERRHVDTGYRDLPFPFEPVEVAAPPAMERSMSRAQLLGYVETWSAVSAMRRSGTDPVPGFTAELEGIWPDAGECRTARWPVALRVGRVG